jgi:tRNA (cytidine/uridine-2'-O-)-methyltransferase
LIMVTIALHEPQIPPNTGNIARLAVGLDVELVLIGPMGFSLDEKQVRRAGLDYWKYLNLTLLESWKEFIKWKSERRVVMATTRGGTPYYDFKYKQDDILLFGSETSGIPIPVLKENYDMTVTIPMPGEVRSLNLSNSVAIIAYHALIETGYFEGFHHNRNINEL